MQVESYKLSHDFHAFFPLSFAKLAHILTHVTHYPSSCYDILSKSINVTIKSVKTYPLGQKLRALALRRSILGRIQHTHRT
jgi:hypothetical protein